MAAANRSKSGTIDEIGRLTPRRAPAGEIELARPRPGRGQQGNRRIPSVG